MTSPHVNEYFNVKRSEDTINHTQRQALDQLIGYSLKSKIEDWAKEGSVCRANVLEALPDCLQKQYDAEDSVNNFLGTYGFVPQDDGYILNK